MSHRNKSPVLCAAIVIALSSSGCALLNPNRQNWLYFPPSNPEVLLAYDSSEVRSLLADENAREVDVNRFWRDKHTKEEEIKTNPGYAAPPGPVPSGTIRVLTEHGKNARVLCPIKVILQGPGAF
jgi:hypothetical protein